MKTANQPQSLKDENGYTWVSPSYLDEMMNREYSRGQKDGSKEIKHVAVIQQFQPNPVDVDKLREKFYMECTTQLTKGIPVLNYDTHSPEQLWNWIKDNCISNAVEVNKTKDTCDNCGSTDLAINKDGSVYACNSCKCC